MHAAIIGGEIREEWYGTVTTKTRRHEEEKASFATQSQSYRDCRC
jgi:hypothetical protein